MRRFASVQLSRSRFSRLLAAALAALVLGACAWLAPRFESPRLSIVGVELARGTLLEQRLRVRMRVQNPNGRELPVRGLSYDMEVAGQQFAHGVSANAFVVPAFGEAEFDMDVTANVAGALLGLLGRRDSQSGDEVGYRLVGKVMLSSGMLRSLAFEQKGTFRLR